MSRPRTPAEILALPMIENDADAETIADYFKALLLKILYEGEGFSGKRPFGNSGWEHELYGTLAKYGVVKGTCEVEDEREYWYADDYAACDKVLKTAVEALFQR